MLKEVKALADALGERRDPDVALEELRAVARRLGADARRREPGRGSYRAEQARGNNVVAAALERALRRDASRSGWPRCRPASQPAEEVAA